MGLISLVLLSAFTLLYISSAIPKKPPFIEKALGFIKQHLNYLAMGGMIYGFIAFCVAPIRNALPVYMFSAMIGNLLLVIMSLPYTFDKMLGDHESKLNPAILKELRGLLAWISSKDKYFGFAGVVFSFMLFITAF